MQSENNKYRKNAIVAGVMYLLCMVASIGGGLLISDVVGRPNVISAISGEKVMLLWGTILQLVNAFGVMGIAAAFWAPLKEKMPATATGYVALRTIEVALCLVVAFIPVFMIQLVGAGGAVYGDVKTAVNLLLAMRDIYWAYIYTILFCSSGFLFYLMLYKTEIIPRYIAVWGLVALVGVFVVLFVPSIKGVTAILIITNEIYLGVYLLIKGFKTAKV